MSNNYISIDSLNNSHFNDKGVCQVPDDVDFAYIMRQDAAYVAGKMFGDIESAIIHELYADFVSGLAEVMARHFAHYGNVSIYCLDAGFLEQAQRQMSHPGDISVSLDPLLIGDGIIPLGVSRHYYPGGCEERCIAERPGFPLLQAQIAALGGQQKITVFEDDIFSGNSIRGLAQQMAEAGAQIGLVVPGIQVGSPAALQNSHIQCQPVVQFVGEKRPLDDRIDLGDPRDFLLGADGLVIDFGTDEKPCLGRAPYIMPFTSPVARMNIPAAQEDEFSRDILKLNLAFYRALETKGHVVCFKQTDPNFQETIANYGVEVCPDDTMVHIATCLLSDIDSLKAKTPELHQRAKGITCG